MKVDLKRPGRRVAMRQRSADEPLIRAAEAPETAPCADASPLPAHPLAPGLNGRRDGASFIGPKPASEGGGSSGPIMAFANFPLWLREGPWKLGVKVYIPLLIVAIVAAAPIALREAPAWSASTAELPGARTPLCACALGWTLLVLCYMLSLIHI